SRVDGVAGHRPQWWPRRIPALAADTAAFGRARRPKVSKLAANAELEGLVDAKPDDDWSIRRIAQSPRREHSGAARSRTNPSTVTCTAVAEGIRRQQV